MQKFQLRSSFLPVGNQPQAIEKLVKGLKSGLKHQVLLGVTGSGKTFTMANVIAMLNRPTLVISHNKTLAAQLFQEYRDFFPKNAVEYFVSYYDYYQPEAYLPQTDTYIEKDAGINEEIDKLRLSTTTALMSRRDVVVVASVSCIYNLGSPQEYLRSSLELRVGMPLRREDLLTRLIQLFYERVDYDFKRGAFRVRGDSVDIYPAYLDYAIRLELKGDSLALIKTFNPQTSKLNEESNHFTLFPAKHYITADDQRDIAIRQIREDLGKRLQELRRQGKDLEAYRLEQKTNYDLELVEELGFCKGIENYSRYFDNRAPGEPPFTLIDFFPKSFLVIIDESHISVPQLRGMYRGDEARKKTLIDYGFRLPSALDNRPWRFEEFLARAPRIIYTSATPGEWEIQQAFTAAKSSGFPGVIEQFIRPTGLLDPEIEIRGTQYQVQNVIDEIQKRVKKGERTLVTTLTKRMAEDFATYLNEQGIKVHHLHADVTTLDRVDILENLRRGRYDVVVGINLLREGLDLPEVSLVAILDADKEGFLRSETSLIQTMGRAARHLHGKVILYADTITGSMRRAIDEVNRRRKIQEEYNQKHQITPQSIQKPIREKLIEREAKKKVEPYTRFNLFKGSTIYSLTREMQQAAKELDFEKAAFLRDRIADLVSNPSD